MKITYLTSHELFLEQLMYSSSISKHANTTRIRNRWILSLLPLAIGIYETLQTRNYLVVIFMLFMALAFYFFYPIYSRWRYGRHFKKVIATDFKERLDQKVHLSITNDSLEITESASAASIKFEEIIALVELNNIFAIQLKSGQLLPVPKGDISETLAFIRMFENRGVEHVDKNGWKW
ncbi:MAG: hypothetical protein WBA16_05800 [Nonlabens sp.]